MDEFTQYLSDNKSLHIGVLCPNVKYKHVLPSYLKIANLALSQGHTLEIADMQNVLRTRPDILVLSTVFSFYSKKYDAVLDRYSREYPSIPVFVGGVFATNQPQYFESRPGVSVIRGLSPDLDAQDYDFSLFPDVSKLAINTSRGCVNACPFCCVPRVEGDMSCKSSILAHALKARERNACIDGLVVLDNNFTNHEHFFEIVEEFQTLGLPVDFSQGLDCVTTTEKQIEALSRLSFKSQSEKGPDYIRFAFDKDFQADGIERTLRWVTEYGIRANYFAYCLYNFTESPEELYSRIQKAHRIAKSVGKPIYLFPQEYEPLDALERHKHVSARWTFEQLRGLRKLLTHLRGFLPVGYDSVFNWLGRDERVFLQHIEDIGQGKLPCKAGSR